MSEDPASRQGRVSRKPLFIVLLILLAVATIGAIASSLARDEDETTVPVAPPIAITSEVPATEYPTTPPSVATQSGTEAVSADGDSCTPDALLTAVRNSGQVDASVADEASVTRFNCIGEYGYTRLSAPGVGEAQAYFKDEGDTWKVLVLGTSIDPEAAGVPADTVRQLAAQ